MLDETKSPLTSRRQQQKGTSKCFWGEFHSFGVMIEKALSQVARSLISAISKSLKSLDRWFRVYSPNTLLNLNFLHEIYKVIVYAYLF